MRLLIIPLASLFADAVFAVRGFGMEGFIHYEAGDIWNFHEPEWNHFLCGHQYKQQHCEEYDCCSKAGYCGHDSRSCNVRSQKEYGYTPIDPYLPPPPPKLMARESSGMRCGVNFGNVSCEEPECCSEAGFCGIGSGFCTAPGCQTEFGDCDAEDIPGGLDLSQNKINPWTLPSDTEMVNRCTRPRTLALTYDDGPNKHTSRILDLLEENNATATFFIAGITNDKGQIDVTPEWVRDIKRMVVNGHQVASHTWSHPRLDEISQEARKEEMYKNGRAIANIVGGYPSYMRPPYSECSTFTESSCLSDMAELGYRVVGFELDTADTEAGATLESMKAAVDKAFSEKSPDGNMLVIQHEHTRFSYELTEYLIEKAFKMDWKVDTVGNCLDDDHPNWLRVPPVIAINSVAKGGCHFATPGFCGTIKPFTDRISCFESALRCRRDARKCDQEDCPMFDAMCEKTEEYCNECGVDQGEECDSNVWQLQPYWMSNTTSKRRS